MICHNCGNNVAINSNFCNYCGASIISSNFKYHRTAVYEGEIHKCSNCGEIINSFVSYCPSCGCEFRGVSNSDAIQKFAFKLSSTKSHQEKIAIIRNFPVPNTREDIIEFLILASSNCDKSQGLDVIEAWMAKMSQCIQKAKLCIDGESLSNIQGFYDTTVKKAKKQCAILKLEFFVKRCVNGKHQNGSCNTKSKNLFNDNSLSIVIKFIFKNTCVFIALMSFCLTIIMDYLGEDVTGAGFVLLGGFFLVMATLLLLRKNVTYLDIIVTICATILTFCLNGLMCDENGAVTILMGVLATLVLIPVFVKKLNQE